MQNMDIGAAILDMAGAQLPDSFEAQTALPALRGEDWAGRDYVYSEQMTDGIYTDGPFMTMIRDQRWKLVHFLDEDYGQLFDLETDPDEFKNLWDDPAGAEAKVRMLAELREWHIRSQVHTATWSEDWR